jgi:DNA-binding transcriptional LysR family regulator
MLKEIENLKLKDLEIFEEVARAQSIREVARRRQTTSGQISKAVQNLEKILGVRLFKRSVRGVLLSAQGTELRTLVAEILESGEKIQGLVSGKNKTKLGKTWAIAGTSFLNTHFTTPLICRLAPQWPGIHFRFLDMTPDQMVGLGCVGVLKWPFTSGSFLGRAVGYQRKSVNLNLS